MVTIVEERNLADLYHLPLVEWAAVTARLDRGVTQAPGTGGPDRHTCWLADQRRRIPARHRRRRDVGRRHILVRDR
jgi:hypothetical protein